MTFNLKQNDTSPNIQAQMFDGDGSPVDITNATVRFHVRNAEGAFRARLLASPERNTVKFAGITKVVINALGEGAINVCGEGGDVQPGNLIVTSSTPGKGMKQADGIVRSYTVAKAREAVTFDSPGDIKMVACIYLCG